jgi:hypothetical protein
MPAGKLEQAALAFIHESGEALRQVDEQTAREPAPTLPLLYPSSTLRLPLDSPCQRTRLILESVN